MRLLELLGRLELVTAEQPLPSDLVSGWFDDVTAQKLIFAGFTTLGELRVRITVGGRWYAALPWFDCTAIATSDSVSAVCCRARDSASRSSRSFTDARSWRVYVSTCSSAT